MASGLAVAGFDYAAARQFVRHGENGLAVPFGEPAGLIAAGEMLATDEFLRAKLRLAARPAVEAHSWERVIGRFEADVRAAATEPAPAAAVPMPA